MSEYLRRLSQALNDAALLGAQRQAAQVDDAVVGRWRKRKWLSSHLEVRVELEGAQSHVCWCEEDITAELIANAPGDIAALLAEVKRLTEAVRIIDESADRARDREGAADQRCQRSSDEIKVLKARLDLLTAELTAETEAHVQVLGLQRRMHTVALNALTQKWNEARQEGVSITNPST